MPVDVGHGRHYTGKPDPLGAAVIWDCPGCGHHNEGNRPEDGCSSCGAGKPGVAGKPQEGNAPPAIESDAPTTVQPPAGRPPAGPSRPSLVRPVESPSQVVYRLIEYIVNPGGEDGFAETFRRSLVGSVELGWGRITATVVDDASGRQMDLLGLAKRQPGIWIANPDSMRSSVGSRPIGIEPPRRREVISMSVDNTAPPDRPQDPPDTGPSFTPQQQEIAASLAKTLGFGFCYTLALALQNVANEIAGLAEDEARKFLPEAECLSWANAFMQQVPQDWAPAAEE